ncbi:TPA: transcriptional regulator [Escherichia coli]|nr:transcriptional regulator [Escherichia coli]HAX5183409.1 transcriptional regulator [Escherichia coli]HAX5232917.1 transcriptional regulator [Escherichia coli]
MAIKKSKCEDKSRYDIVADLRKRGKSLAALGRENGLSASTVKNALDKPYPRCERIIADALGVEPSDIWPSRY